MASKQRSVEEIIGKLREAGVALAQGETVAQACRGIGVSDHTFYRWRQQYGGLRIDQARRLREMEAENGRTQACGSGPDVGQPDSEGGSTGKLLSPARRRRCVEVVGDRYGISERRACRALEQPRSTQRYTATVADDEEALTMAVVRLASRYGTVWVPAGDCHAAMGGMESEPQAGGADLATGKTQGTSQTAQTGPTLAY